MAVTAPNGLARPVKACGGAAAARCARVGGDELPHGEVYSLWVDEAGQAWAGTDDGVYRLAGGVWQPFPLGTVSGAGEPECASSPSSRIPPAASGLAPIQGLFYYSGSGSSVERYGRAEGMVSEYVRAMSLDDDGALWLGTVGGVSRYGGRTWRAERETGLRGQAVNAVYTDRSGRTWAGTDGQGVALWDGKTWRWFGSKEGLADTQVFSLYEDRSGRLWAGTASGVALWDGSGGAWRSFGTAEGIANPPVWAIGDDAGGDLWIGTENGILRGNERKGFQPVPEFAGRRRQRYLQQRRRDHVGRHTRARTMAVTRDSLGAGNGSGRTGIFERGAERYRRIPRGRAVGGHLR